MSIRAKFEECLEQVSVREANENEPTDEASLRGKRRQSSIPGREIIPCSSCQAIKRKRCGGAVGIGCGQLHARC